MPRPTLYLIDTFGFLFRAYHARARSGAPPMRTSAGQPTEVVFIFNNMLKKLRSVHKPGYLAAVFESEGPTLREQSFAEYKAHRPPVPEEFLSQLPGVKRLLDALHVARLEYPGYEADDVIGTIARSAAGQGADVVIVSSDKDMLQLVDDHITMLNPAKDDETYNPSKAAEFMGVAPQQIPDLLALMGDSADNIPGAPGIGSKGARDLIERFGCVEQALARAGEVERKAYRESLENNRRQIEMSKQLATIATGIPIEWDMEQLAVRPPDEAALRQIYTELEFFSQIKELAPVKPAAEWKLGALASPEEARDWLNRQDATVVAACIGTTGEGLLAETRLGLSARDGEGVSLDPEWAESWLEDAGREKSVYDAKSFQAELYKTGRRLRGIRDDVMLYEFLLSADPSACSWEVLSLKYLDRTTHAVEEMAAGIRLMAARLNPEIDRRNLRRLYEEVDLPLAPVLARMERHGVRVEPRALASLSARMETETARLTAAIHEQAGHAFNINSPQQLAKVLFEEMGLPAPTVRGKGKPPSTAAGVLETLAEHHRVVQLVLDYRQLAKLKNTYADTLPRLMDARQRVHTTFSPVGAATGRLSSSNPNLQNIPIRTELGREIRAAFVPEPGWKLVVADYSQIELRLLAHLSGDTVLVEAFRNGEDVHTRTASEVFGVMPAMVDAEMRRNAKAVNFGIVYGLSGFGLAGQLGIPRPEAERYIKAYFDRYRGVRRFIDDTIAEVRKTGVTRTLFGRERPIPDINSRNPNARGFAERTAVNTPLQGAAADLIKAAMIRIDHNLEREGMQSRMLLQVHDELVFEAPPEEVERLAAMVRREMEGVYRLDVPLVAGIGSGDNWRDAK